MCAPQHNRIDLAGYSQDLAMASYLVVGKAVHVFVLTLGVSPRVSCSHLDSWLEEFQSNPTPREVRDMVRDMNCATSQKVFIGKRSPHPHTAALRRLCCMCLLPAQHL